MFACNFVSLYVKSLLKFDKCNRRGTARAESPHATDEVTRNCRRLTRYSANLATTDGHVVSSTTTARRWSASVSRSWMDPARGAGSRRSSHGGERPVMQSIAAAVGHDDDVDVIAMRVVAVCRRGPVQSSPLSHVTRCRRPSSLPVADSRCTTRTAPPPRPPAAHAICCHHSSCPRRRPPNPHARHGPHMPVPSRGVDAVIGSIVSAFGPLESIRWSDDVARPSAAVDQLSCGLHATHLRLIIRRPGRGGRLNRASPAAD